MTWTLLNAEPAYGICDQCRKDSCGFVDGKHMWIDTGITDRSGDSIVIGYGCVKTFADNLGITKEVVEREVLRPPTDDELGAYIRKLVGDEHERGDSGIGVEHSVAADSVGHDDAREHKTEPSADIKRARARRTHE